MNFFINFLTFFRLFSGPIICGMLLLTFYPSIAFTLFIFASLSDYFDGYLARKYSLETAFGEVLDPIADKILVAAALVLLVMNGIIKNYEVIAAIVILTREILISGLREFLAKRNQASIPVSSLSKFKTFIQMLSIAMLLTGETGNKIINFQDYNAQTVGIILLWIAAFITIYTGYDYLRKGIDSAISDDEKK